MYIGILLLLQIVGYPDTVDLDIFQGINLFLSKKMIFNNKFHKFDHKNGSLLTFFLNALDLGFLYFESTYHNH